MSLYNHMANKDNILDGIIDLVVGESTSSRTRSIGRGHAPKGDPGPTVFSRHPWASVLIDWRESSGPARCAT